VRRKIRLEGAKVMELYLLQAGDEEMYAEVTEIRARAASIVYVMHLCHKDFSGTPALGGRTMIFYLIASVAVLGGLLFGAASEIRGRWSTASIHGRWDGL
jgi:hypothetical protein